MNSLEKQKPGGLFGLVSRVWAELCERFESELVSLLFRAIDRIIAGAVGTAIGATVAYFLIRFLEGH